MVVFGFFSHLFNGQTKCLVKWRKYWCFNKNNITLHGDRQFFIELAQCVLADLSSIYGFHDGTFFRLRKFLMVMLLIFAVHHPSFG